MKIYTKAGDFGMTSTITGERISKASYLMETQGSIDEVNSYIGYLRALLAKYGSTCSNPLAVISINEFLKKVQHMLFCVGADLTHQFAKHYVKEEDILELENYIDVMTAETGSLKSFIYLSGHETASYAHIIRSVTRRAERQFVALLQAGEKQETDIPNDYKYMNRLADYFFQLARYLNFLFGAEEEIMHL